MFKSNVIEINGTFVGAALTCADGVRFHAVHPTVDKADRRIWGSVAELRLDVARLVRTGDLAEASQKPVHGAPANGPPVLRSGGVPRDPAQFR